MGEEPALGVARVVGSAIARMAESLSAATRLVVEIPALASVASYLEVARQYTSVARETLPAIGDAIEALLRRHLVLVSYQVWSTDEDCVAVALERTVGFIDLVGSTEVLRELSVSQMAAMVDSFETLTWDTVTAAGGRLVKLIGDEAMFVLNDPGTACRVAQSLLSGSAHPVRVGLAHGLVVALRGDYYGRPSTWRLGWSPPRRFLRSSCLSRCETTHPRSASRAATSSLSAAPPDDTPTFRLNP